MAVTLSGISMPGSAAQPSKQLLLMLVMPCGRVTFSSCLAPEKRPLGSLPVALASLPSVKTASEMSTAVTTHSPFFSLALLRLTICWSSLTSALLSGPLTFSSEILNISSFWICFASCPTVSTVTFFETCAEVSRGSAASAMKNSLFIINRFILLYRGCCASSGGRSGSRRVRSRHRAP